MTKDLIQINYRQEYVGIRTYKIKYIAEITHRGFNDFKVLTSDHSGILQNKVIAHIAKLEESGTKLLKKKIFSEAKKKFKRKQTC